MPDNKSIDQEKIKSAINKVTANPKLLKGVNDEFDKFFNNLGISLNNEERRAFIRNIAPDTSRMNGGCANIVYCPSTIPVV